MSRPLSERVKDWRWWLDQALHIGLGAVAASVLWIGQPIVAGAAAALWAALLREREQWPPGSWGDMIVDVLATVSGGLVMGLVVWAVA